MKNGFKFEIVADYDAASFEFCITCDGKTVSLRLTEVEAHRLHVGLAEAFKGLAQARGAGAST